MIILKRFKSTLSKKHLNPILQREGTGGRSSISGHTTTVFGSTGFLGRYLVNNLGKRGSHVVVPFRGTEDEKRHLKLMGDLGQIVPLSFDLRNDERIIECIRHSDVVYNLIGKDFQTKNFNFQKVHVDGARTLAKLAKQCGVSKFIHVSALNADPDSKSLFLKTKGLGEKAVLEEFPEATIVRPGYMYGHEDRFWNRFGFYTKWSPIGMPLINKGKTIIRPVYVGDVAAVLAQLEEVTFSNKLVELAGFLAGVAERLMFNPVATADEVERYFVSDSLQNGSLKFEDFGIKPHTVEETISRFVRMYQSEDHIGIQI
ncbi:39kDa subunit of ndufa9, NADH:ubiquinone oxidoreductase [Clydaea vesicula]|uniref:39kDa subunit of ndufa9, NADH:ubiquinone oxidoreductase n=1 Tax=Clydaea vesicula TaxID=447962 RepID=A0AAD5U7H3_9FUNG|nr:39kDa subunit of ndufa9, NADH:ubiquinone oxidoreductase [Clydaea vesicula]